MGPAVIAKEIVSIRSIAKVMTKYQVSWLAAVKEAKLSLG